MNDSHDDNLEYEILSDDYKNHDLVFKIIIIGDSGVGKSCLALKGIKKTFIDYYTPTIGFEFYTFNIRINDSIIKLQIWDTCGQEAFRSLINSFYRNSALAMIIYAIDDINSYNHIEEWLNEIKTKVGQETKLYLIGNKLDLEKERQVNTEDAEKFSLDNEFDFFIETSAKTGFNAEKVFIQAAKDLYKKNIEYQKKNSENKKENKKENYQIQENKRNNVENNHFIIKEEDNDDDNIQRKKKCSC
jgi:small GTP-binding protein